MILHYSHCKTYYI